MDPLPPPPPRTTTPPMMEAAYERNEKKNGKKKLLVFVVCGFLMSLGVYYFFFAKQADIPRTFELAIPTISRPTPTPDPTVTWQTYTASNSAFSFKFPKEWVYDERKTTVLIAGKSYSGVSIVAGIPYTSEQIKSQGYLTTEQAPKNYENFSLVYAVSPDFTVLPLETIADDVMSKKVLVRDTKKKIVLNDLLDAIEVGYGCQAACADIIFKKGDTVFDTGTGPNADANIAMLRQILSTFKFQ